MQCLTLGYFTGRLPTLHPEPHVTSIPAYLESCLTRLDWRFMVVAGALAALQASQREPPHSSICRSPQTGVHGVQCCREGDG